MPSLVADTPLVEQSYSRGIVRDTARHAIPAGGVYDAVDFLFDRPGVAYKRGGSSFLHSALAGQALIIAVAAPEFPSGPRVVVIASDGASTRTLYDVTGGTVTSVGSVHGAQPTENPPLYVDRLIVTDGIGNGSGTYYQPQKVYISAGNVAVADLGGSPPNVRCSCVHLGYLVLANTTANPNRVFFAPTGTNDDIEDTWDTTLGFIDTAAPVVGMASIAGMLLVFHRGSFERILGSIPPATVGENMSLQPGAGVGCIDARSIVKMGGLVYFASESGVYATNGGAPATVTSRPDGTGIDSLWKDAVNGYSPSLGSVVCAGVWLDQHLFVTVRHAASDPQSGARYQFLYHSTTGAWTRLADGVTADMYATAFAPVMEIYAAGGDSSDAVRLLKLSGLFTPASGNKNDANGEAVAPTLTYRTLEPGAGLKAWGHGHLAFDMRDASSDNPTLAVATAPGLEATSFTTRSTLAETTDLSRQRFDVNTDSLAMTVKVTQANASSKTELYALGVDARPYDEPSEGQ